MPQPNLNSSDYYQILGCNRNADDATIKKAYRKLAVKWHPDKNPNNPGATEKFQKISEAYATLSDKTNRQQYDQFGKDSAWASDSDGQGGMPGGFGGFDPGGFGGAQPMSNEDAQKMFSTFFGGSDPFGGGTGMGPGMSFQTNGMPPGMGGGGGSDPISMMFQGMGGMPGMASMGGMPGMASMGGMPGMASMGGMPGMTSMGGMPGMASMGGMPGMASMGGMPGMASMGGMPGMSSVGGMPGMGGAPVPQHKSYDSIPPGTVVSLIGLENSPDRNGDRGVIKQYVPSKSRYAVDMEDYSANIKPSNILQHSQVRIHDLKSQPELNGKTGTIIAWNQSNERYNIYVITVKKVVSLKAGNVVLHDGTVGKITGIIAKPELNGKWGTIQNWIRETNKYDIKLSADKIVRVKVENVRV